MKYFVKLAGAFGRVIHYLTAVIVQWDMSICSIGSDKMIHAMLINQFNVLHDGKKIQAI